MDTTAAAELGDVPDGGLGFWDKGAGREPEGWAPVERSPQQGWGRPGPGPGSGPGPGPGSGPGPGPGSGAGGVGGDGFMGKPPNNRAGASGGPVGGMDPPAKRMRQYNGGGGGGGDGFGMGAGGFGNTPPPPRPPGNFPPDGPENGSWGSPSPAAYGGPNGQGGSPSIRNNPGGGGGAGSNFSQGTAPPSSGDQYGQSPGVRGRGMSIFYKTKLCSRFRNGSCPFNTNCNFAHGTEELRTPPPGWEDVAAAQDGSGGGGGAGGRGFENGAVGAGNGGSDGGLSGSNAQGGSGGGGGGNWPSNQSPMPNQGSSPAAAAAAGGGGGVGGGGSGEMPRYHRPRPCKKFSTETGCPYGDRCIFSHDEAILQASKSSRDVAAAPGPGNLGGSANGGVPASSGGGGNAGPGGRRGEGGGAGGSGDLGGGGDVNGNAGSAGSGAGTPGHRPPNWKTRLCNKWETTGHCPFGDKCHFAHGSAELQRYGGGPIDGSDDPGFQMDTKYSQNSGNFGDGDDGSPYCPDGGGTRHPSSYPHHHSRLNSVGPRFSAIWNGPTEGISTIYGDWPDEED